MKNYTREMLSSLLCEVNKWNVPEDALEEYTRIYKSLSGDKKVVLERLKGLERKIEEEGGWRASPVLLSTAAEDYERLGL